MKKTFVMLIAALAFTACETGTGKPEKEITVTQGTMEITVNADQTAIDNGNGIRFTTTGPWYAEVEDITGPGAVNPVEWITLSQTSGDTAGDYVVKITLAVNDSAKDRKAVIKIICGNTTITVNILQKGTVLNGDKIILTDGTTEYVLNAEQIAVNDGNGIKFTTTGPWDSKIIYQETNAAKWITLTPESGDKAGEYTMTITLDENTSDQERKANITLSCGQSDLNVKIIQNGRNEPDRGVGLVKSITYDPFYCIEDPYMEGRITYSFEYDTQKRISAFTAALYEVNGSLSYELKTSLDYSEAGQILITEKEIWKPEESYTVVLNDDNYAAKVRIENIHTGRSVTYNFEYTDERLSKLSWNYAGIEYWNEYTYKNGVLSSFTSYDGYESKTEKGLELDFGSMQNNSMNIDPNALFVVLDKPDAVRRSMNSDRYDILGRLNRLAMLRLIGKGTDYLIINHDPNVYRPGKNRGPYTKPNKTIRESEALYTYESDGALTYELYDGGYVSSVRRNETVSQILHEYDVVVGNELINSGMPEKGYKYYIQNETVKRGSNGTNIYRYYFSYVK